MLERKQDERSQRERSAKDGPLPHPSIYACRAHARVTLTHLASHLASHLAREHANAWSIAVRVGPLASIEG